MCSLPRPAANPARRSSRRLVMSAWRGVHGHWKSTARSTIVCRMMAGSRLTQVGAAFPFVLLQLFACSHDESPEATAATAQHLQALVSEPFDIEPFPQVDYQQPNGAVNIGCGSTRCLAVYSQNIDDGGTVGYATRLSASPAALDLPRIILPSVPYPSAVYARDDDFLVVGTNGKSFELIRGGDGAVLPNPTSTLPSSILGGAATKSTWLFITANMSSNATAQLYGADFSRVATDLTIPNDSKVEAVIAGEGQFLLVWQGKAVRIRESDGVILDNPPIHFARYGLGPVRGIYSNGIYQLAWTNNYDLWGSRIRASDGTSLDPDDEFNNISGAKALCHLCTVSAFPSVANNDFDLDVVAGTTILSWRSYDGSATSEVYAVPIDVTLGTRPDGSAAKPSTPVASVGYQSQIHALGNAGLFVEGVYRDTMSSFVLSSSPFGLQRSTAIRVPMSSATRGKPAIASDGTDYLVVFNQGGSFYASIINGATGAYAGAPALLGEGVDTPVVAFDGSMYLVAWMRTASIGVVGRARVSSLGVVTPLSDVSFKASLDSGSLRLVCNGTYHLLTAYKNTETTANLGLRMAPDGVVLDASPKILTAVAASPNYAIAADSTPPDERKSFLLVSSVLDKVAVRRLRSQSGSVIEPVTTLASATSNYSYNPIIASDGTQFLILYQTASSSSVAARNLEGILIDPVSGSPVSSSVKTYFSMQSSLAASELWYDGKGFNAVLRSSAVYETPAYYLQRFDSNCERLDAALDTMGTPITTTMTRGNWNTGIAVASAKNGRSLFVYQDVEASRSGVAIKARFIDNDGLPSVAGAVTGAAGSTGAGGASGTAGTTTPGGTTAQGFASLGGTSSTGGTTFIRNPGTFAGDAGTSNSPYGTVTAGGTLALGGGHQSTILSAAGSDSVAQSTRVPMSSGGASVARTTSLANSHAGSKGEVAAETSDANADSSGCSCRTMRNSRSPLPVGSLLFGWALLRRRRHAGFAGARSRG